MRRLAWPGVLAARARAIAPLRYAIRTARALATPQGRSRWRLERRAAATLLQPVTQTFPDRHPPLFRAVADLLVGVASPRLLSYGCSTGEEVLALAEYMPEALIDGIDINPWCIARARRAAARHSTPRARFICAGTPAAAPAGQYDAIFCLSVLRHARLDAEMPDDCSATMPFAKFEEAVAALDRLLRPGGLLIFWGCNFRFADSALAERYSVLPVPGKRAQPGPFYGADNRRMSVDQDDSFLFRKLLTE